MEQAAYLRVNLCKLTLITIDHHSHCTFRTFKRRDHHVTITLSRKEQGGIVRRHLVMFASLFLFLWAAISIGCSSKPAEESSDSSAPPSKSASLFGPKEVTLPAGTVLTVRLASTVGSKTSNTGDRFNATIATPVASDGKVVLPKGTEVQGKVAQAVPQGRFKGGASLSLALESVTVGGDAYDIKTNSVSRYQKGKGKRTAAMIGGGAGGGALIGGLAGGGKGALIGALLGGGAGTAGAAYTGEKEIVLPAESMLSFKLTESLIIKM